MSVARKALQRSFTVVACMVNDSVLLNEIPLTFGPVPGAPLSEARLILDLTTVDDPDTVSALMQLLMRERTLLTWMLAERATAQGVRCQGYLSRVVFPTTLGGRTTMMLEMHLPADCTRCQNTQEA